MDDPATDIASPAIGAIHFRLRVPHADLADYRQLQQMIVAPFVRRQSWRNFAVGLPIGALIAMPVAVATIYWKFRGELILKFGLGHTDHPIVVDGVVTWLAVLVVFFAGYVAARIDGILIHKTVFRRIFAHSSRQPSDWILLVGESGFQMIIRGVVTIIPWSTTNGIREGRSASFLMVNDHPSGVVISHGAFASAEERTACLDFMRSKVPAVSS